MFFAVYASKRKEENLRQLKLFLEDVIIWDYDIIAAEEFGKVQAEQKAKGKPFLPLIHKLLLLHVSPLLFILKQLKKYSDNWVLHPLNLKYDDIVVKEDEILVIGKIVKREKRFD